MKPWSSFLLFCSFAMGTMAKGRGGRGGSGGGSIDDNWNVPGTVKAMMAFDIIYFVITTGLFITILRRLRFVPPGRYTRAPYILLAVVTGPLALAYLLLAIHLRIRTDINSSASVLSLNRMGSFISFLFAIDVAFRPAVCLWLVHLRGNLPRMAEGKSTKPWISQFWKRIVDWSLVAITFLFAISTMAVLANLFELQNSSTFTSGAARSYLDAQRGLSFTTLAFSCLLAIDITVSFIALKISQKSMNFVDPISTRLLVAVLPFVIIGFIESLAVTIIQETQQNSFDLDFNALYLADTIISGAVVVGIIGGLLSTMTIPNALWVPAAALPSTGAGYVPQQPQQPQQSFYQPPWQISPSMPAPGQYPHPGQYQAPQNPPPGHQTYNP